MESVESPNQPGRHVLEIYTRLGWGDLSYYRGPRSFDNLQLMPKNVQTANKMPAKVTDFPITSRNEGLKSCLKVILCGRDDGSTAALPVTISQP